MRLISPRPAAWLGLVLATLPLSIARADVLKDSLVQAPTLAAPERGSLAGTLAHTSFGAAEVAQGAFALVAPLGAPSSRGPLLAQVFPRYAPSQGLSEWGQGWGTDLSIRRFRPAGDLDYQTDELESPWGPLRPGDDGAYYPAGLRQFVRVKAEGNGLVATLSDGKRFTFLAADGVTTARGVYAWYLHEVRSLSDDVTTLEWQKNASGRPFLQRVTYGGAGLGAQVEILFAYDALPQPFDDYRSGSKLTLDQRVSRVTVRERSAGVGDFLARWTFDLAYQTSSIGPAFYLVAVDKTFASGEHAPLVTYRYDLGADRLASARLEQVAGLGAFLSGAGDIAFQPNKSAVSDLDDDGRPDFEHAARQTAVVHTDAGWQIQPLPAPTGQEDTRCRPPYSTSNPPRALARLTAAATEPAVVYTHRYALAGTSTVLVCNRAGIPQREASYPGDWQLDVNTHLVDLNRDLRPDIVHVYADRIEILENQSDAQGVRFAPRASVPVWLGFQPISSWAQDMNGDGIVDLVARSTDGFAVLYGTGNFGFDLAPTWFTFNRQDGTVVGGLSGYQVNWLDANKDGLMDALLSQGTQMFLFTNRGTGDLVEVPVPALRQVTWGFGLPLAADISGRGESEVAFANAGNAYAVDLTSPSTGMLVGADDGMGTVLEFHYGRGPAVTGGGARPVVLSQLLVTSTGLGAVSTQYDFAQPVRHSTGRYLVGFGTVRRTAPQLIEVLNLQHDDDLSGVVLTRSTTDIRSPGATKQERNTYEENLFHGVRWWRKTSADTGWRRADGSAEAMVHSAIEAYDRVRCPTRVRETSSAGELLTETTLAQVTAIDDDLHCLSAVSTLTGRHADATRDFVESVQIARDDQGAVTGVTALGGAGPMQLENVTYDARHRVSSTSRPGHGATIVSYDDSTNTVARVVAPDQVATVADALDPVTDALLAMHNDRGGAGLASSFRYDGQERLERSWDDLGDASETQPDQLLRYAYATATQPASLRVQTRIDARSERETLELQSAAGDPIAKAVRRAGLWDLGMLTQRDGQAAEKTERWRGTLAVDPTTLDLAQLLDGTTALGFERSAGFGHVAMGWKEVESGIEGSYTTSIDLVGTALVTTKVLDSSIVTRIGTDAAGRVVFRDDGSGRRTSYDYDVLGRLVMVTLPSGAHQRVRYDAYGQIARIDRDGVGAMTYGYDPVSGLLLQKSITSSSGRVERTVSYQNDAAGRVSRETATLAQNGATRTLAYQYDGNGQLGYLSGVTGDGFSKQYVHDRAGRMTENVTTVPGWRSIDVQHRYGEDGTSRGETWIVRDGGGTQLSRVDLDQQFDADGRVVGLALGGQNVATVVYDGEGQLARVDAGGSSVIFDRDPTTRRMRGQTTHTSDGDVSTRWHLDARALVTSEDFTVAGTLTSRSYDHDARGFLVGFGDGGGAHSSYAYDVDGRITTQTDVTYDDLGRVIRRGSLSLTYGASGDVEIARRGDVERHYVYDEQGQRVVKLADGRPITAYVDGAYLDEQQLILPVRVADRLIGVIENGIFRVQALDERGSVVAEGGVANLPGPYGERASHPALAAALDYVAKGYDADLDAVRMGARDYDPELATFRTPDPMFLEKPELCRERPAECNLYGYAANDPIGRIDPTGLGSENGGDSEDRDGDLQKGLSKANSFSDVAGTINEIAAHLAEEHFIEKFMATQWGRGGLLLPAPEYASTKFMGGFFEGAGKAFAWLGPVFVGLAAVELSESIPKLREPGLANPDDAMKAVGASATVGSGTTGFMYVFMAKFGGVAVPALSRVSAVFGAFSAGLWVGGKVETSLHISDNIDSFCRFQIFYNQMTPAEREQFGPYPPMPSTWLPDLPSQGLRQYLWKDACVN